MKYKFENPVVGHTGTEKYACTLQWRNGTILSDEPVTGGGGDTGPDPHSLLLSSLAACTLITLRMYIDRKGWDVPNLSVKVNMFTVEKDGKNVTTLDRDLDVPGDLADEKKMRLKEIASHCPISRLLEGETRVRTFLQRNPAEAKKITYANDQVSIHWKPELCQHSGRCFSQLPAVFNPRNKKWIVPDGGTPEAILEQVGRCPSGALTANKTAVSQE